MDAVETPACLDAKPTYMHTHTHVCASAPNVLSSTTNRNAFDVEQEAKIGQAVHIRMHMSQGASHLLSVLVVWWERPCHVQEVKRPASVWVAA